MIIYKITNSINNKIYIGLTTKSLEERIRTHKNSLKTKSNRPLYNAMNKYGFENFKFETIYTAFDKEELCKQEIYFISLYNSTDIKNGYNLSSGGEVNTISAEGRLRISEKNKERWLKNRELYMERINKRKLPPKLYKKKGLRKNLEKDHKIKISLALKGNTNFLKNGLHVNSKRVICVETNEIFNNVTEAKLKYNKGNIHKAARNGTTSMGNHWKYI